MIRQIQTTEKTQGALTIMTPKQAAEAIQVSVETIWEKCRSGELGHIRLSPRCYRIRGVDLEKYLNSRAR
jgi:excisionase family DNA binding protein